MPQDHFKHRCGPSHDPVGVPTSLWCWGAQNQTQLSRGALSNSLSPPVALGLTEPGRCRPSLPTRCAAGSWSLCCPPRPSGVLQSCFPTSTGAGIIPPQVQDQAPPFTGFHEIPTSPFLQPGQAPPNDSTIIWCISCTVSPNQEGFSLHPLSASIIKGLMITDFPDARPLE